MIESKHGTLPLDVTAEKYIDELKDIYFLQVLEPQVSSLVNNYISCFLFSCIIYKQHCNTVISILISFSKTFP